MTPTSVTPVASIKARGRLPQVAPILALIYQLGEEEEEGKEEEEEEEEVVVVVVTVVVMVVETWGRALP